MNKAAHRPESFLSAKPRRRGGPLGQLRATGHVAEQALPALPELTDDTVLGAGRWIYLGRGCGGPQTGHVEKRLSSGRARCDDVFISAERLHNPSENIVTSMTLP